MKPMKVVLGLLAAVGLATAIRLVVTMNSHVNRMAAEHHEKAGSIEAIPGMTIVLQPSSRIDFECRLQPGGKLDYPEPNWANVAKDSGHRQDERGTPVLFLIVTQGDSAMVKDILHRGADPNARNGYGQTALMAAAWSGNVACAQALLKHHASVTAQDTEGRTALQWATSERKDDVAALLKAAGARS